MGKWEAKNHSLTGVGIEIMKAFKRSLSVNHSRKGVRIEIDKETECCNSWNHSRKGVCIEMYTRKQTAYIGESLPLGSVY